MSTLPETSIFTGAFLIENGERKPIFRNAQFEYFQYNAQGPLLVTGGLGVEDSRTGHASERFLGSLPPSVDLVRRKVIDES